jgi:hypothetical protein
MEPDEWLHEQSALPVANAKLKVFSTSNPPEAVCLIERDGGVLITGDSLQHTPTPDEFFNWPAKLMMKRFGFFKPYNVGPGWLQFAHPTASDVHGAAVIGDAKEKYRPAIEGELKGCHT